MNKRMTFLLVLIGLLVVGSGTLQAETKEARAEWKNEFRLTMSDWLFESLIWHDAPHFDYRGAGADNTVFLEDHKYVHTPHFGAEYMRRINQWCSVGLLGDFQYTQWYRMRYNNQNAETGRTKEYFYNVAIVPTVQFTYLWTEHVSLYSSLGVGADINGGTETDLQGHKTAAGVAINMTALGIRVCKGRWYGCAEFGGMYALKNINAFYQIGSRMISIGAGVAF